MDFSSSTTSVLYWLASHVFLALFIVFLVKSINRGKTIERLNKRISELEGKAPAPVYPPYMPMGIPQPMYTPYQSVPVQTPVMAPQQAPVAAAVPIAEASSVAAVPTPSWAVPPSVVQNNRQQNQAVINQTETEKPHREKFFSSINITFGIGVLLLTIVGATFMTGSWPWMTEEVRAVSLVILVFLVYGMSFLAGKVLKLQQTGFAMYSLASLLGPIVIVGMGSFNLLGSAFSFKDGTGWLVATVAALVLFASAVIGRFIFREGAQANVYRGTTYISLTWLVVFLSGQIGQASDFVSEWGMICLGLATLALAFRILSMTKLFEDEAFFRVYSEIITYIPAGLLLFSFAFSDGAVFGASIVSFASMVLFAKFTEKRSWLKYLTPIAGMETVITWIAFADSEEMYMVTAITMTIIVIVFVVHKMLAISSGMSDIGLPVMLGAVTTILAVEEVPAMGAVACFLTLAILVFEMTIEPVLARNESIAEGIFRKENSVPLQVVLSILGAVFYYLGMVMVYLIPEKNSVHADIYFTVVALIPAVAAVILRIVLNDDIRIRSAGMVMTITAVISGFFSLFSVKGASRINNNIFCEDLYVCAWILTLAVIVMCVFFIVKPLREKRLSAGAMLWMSLALNALSIGVFLMIEYNSVISWRIKLIPESSLGLVRQIAALFFLGLNCVAMIVSVLVNRKGKELAVQYASGLKHFFSGFASMWFIISWILLGANWKTLIVAIVFAVLLSLVGSEFLAALPVFAAELCIMEELTMNVANRDLRNVLLIGLTVLVAGIGRLVFRKNVFSKKAVDYLSLTSFIMLFAVGRENYVPMMVFFALSLLVMNLAARVKIPVRALVSVFAALICCGIIAQPYLVIPDLIALEYDIALLLGTLLLICKVIKPAPGSVMKYFWFTGVALSIVAEGISAAVTGEVLDLILVGTASFGIFIYAFIRRNRLWFVLGVVSMISIAIYLTLAFWSSLVWLIYLFLAGSILVVMAAINEWGKRHNKDGKKKRFFEEWTW